MDELVYLSPGKLSQFEHSSTRGFSIGRAAAEFQVPVVGAKLSVEGGTEYKNPLYKRLERVRKFIAQYGRAIYHFDDPEVCDGSWIQFELAMSQAIVRSAGLRLLVFCGESNEGHPVTLLLHGSPANLHVPEPRIGPTEDIDLASTSESLVAMLRSLMSAGDAAVDWRRSGVTALVDHVKSVAIGAPLLEGWARVTVVMPPATEPPTDGRVVVASPLYLAHAEREAE